jgi:hypothetical protein
MDDAPYTIGYWKSRALINEERAKRENFIADGRIKIIRDLEQQVERLKLEVHRLDSAMQTEACCTGEMRDSFQREIEGLHQRLNNQARIIQSAQSLTAHLTYLLEGGPPI